jgi:PIN domain nuclease of toxin-antitoxin system
VIILDAYAVLALLKGEAAAPQVRELLHGNHAATLTSLGVAEVIDHLVRLCGADEDEAALDIAQLGLADAIVIDAATALRAGLLRARHYHRRDRAVSLADCIAAATAEANSTAVVTSDPHLLNLCHDEHIRVIVLPDSTGRTWRPRNRNPETP